MPGDHKVFKTGEFSTSVIGQSLLRRCQRVCLFPSSCAVWPGSLVGWLVGFVALRPKSTAMVIAGRSVHLTTLFPGQA